MRALILCGGFGTRLRSVIGETQKAVADVDGKPFLHVIVKLLKQAGITRMVFCTHYHSEQVQQAISILNDVELEIKFVDEISPLGTGGAVLNAIDTEKIEGEFIVLNADTYVSVDAYRDIAQSLPPAIVVSYAEDCSRYGAVKLNEQGLVTGLVEKGVVGSGSISMGIYKFDSYDLKAISRGACSLEKDILPFIISCKKLKAINYSGPFVDIGTPQSLATMRKMNSKR